MAKISSSSVDFENTANRSEIMLEIGQPELYRVNAFRVTGLAVTATAQDLSRFDTKIKIIEKQGGSTGLVQGSLALQVETDLDLIREALQRLRDPEHRLLDEFFWFWPHQLSNKADEALTCITRGDLNGAKQIWLKQENYSENYVSMHNLAVLAHLQALDLEYFSLNQPLTATQIKERDQSWEETFKRWRVLLETESFWSRLTARIKELDDPRLTAGTVRKIRATLPVTLLAINAQLALQAAERGNIGEVNRHQQLVRTSGFEKAVIDEVFNEVAKPIRKRIQNMCKNAEAAADADVFHADQTAGQLLSQTGVLLKVLDDMLPAGHSTRDGAHDEVALQAFSCQISYANKTDIWDSSLPLLERVLPIARSESARNRILKNIETVNSNIEYDQLYGRCWFCKTGKMDEKASLNVAIHGEIKRTRVNYNRVEVTWKHNKINVPRCSKCQKIHGLGSGIMTTVMVISIIIGISGCIMVTGNNSTGGPVLLTGVIGFILACCLEPLICVLSHTKSENHRNSFPKIKEYLAKGWAFGEKPNTQ